MTRKDQIKNAYKLTGGHAGFYDGMMTYSTLPGQGNLPDRMEHGRRKDLSLSRTRCPVYRKISREMDVVLLTLS